MFELSNTDISSEVLSMNIMSKPGQLSWLKNDKITFTSLHALNRKTWILSNEKNSLSNLVSEYSDARGTYVV